MTVVIKRGGMTPANFRLLQQIPSRVAQHRLGDVYTQRKDQTAVGNWLKRNTGGEYVCKVNRLSPTKFTIWIEAK